MSYLNLRIPGFANPDTNKKASHADNPGHSTSDSQGSAIELRIVQDGRIYRSKAEQDRLVALGQWHHRRRRRRDRLRG